MSNLAIISGGRVVDGIIEDFSELVIVSGWWDYVRIFWVEERVYNRR